MSKRGDAGVAKVEGLVIFVAGTKVGDAVKIRITKVGRGYATAEIASQSESDSYWNNNRFHRQKRMKNNNDNKSSIGRNG